MDPRVRQYMMQKYFGAQQPDVLNGADQTVTDAQKQSDNAQLAGVAAGAADNISNAFNQPVALRNRMQDLGKAPAMLEGRQQHTDMSGIQRAADRNLDSAKGDRDQALQMMLQQRKEELSAEAAARRQGVEDDRWNKQFGQKQSEIDATNGLRNATLQNTQSQQGITNDFRRQELDLQRGKAAAERAKDAQGKAAPAETVTKLANYDAARKTIKDIAKNWDDNASQDGAWLQSFGRNTPSNIYEKALPVAIQAVATGLEGGKLSDKDIPRYEAMFPTSSDSKEQKAAKIQALLNYVDQKQQAEVDGLKKAGYGAPDPVGIQQQENPGASGEVTRLDPSSGKRAVFDSNTKQFKRWVE